MNSPAAGYQDYGFHSGSASHMHRHFLPKIFELAGDLPIGTRVLDVGCGNGFTSGEFMKHGCTLVGVDLSESGIALARSAYPKGRFEVISAEDSLLEVLQEEPFDLVVSTEVIEHLYSPRAYIKSCFEALRPGGRFICTTPYHGYLKNLAISLVGAGTGMRFLIGTAGILNSGAERHSTACLERPVLFITNSEGQGDGHGSG